MKSKHTPGPWNFDGLTFIRSNIPVGRPFSKICAIEHGNEGPQEALSNAKLIAASPTMRILLSEEVKYLDMWMKFKTLNRTIFTQMKERKEFIEMTLKATE